MLVASPRYVFAHARRSRPGAESCCLVFGSLLNTSRALFPEPCLTSFSLDSLYQPHLYDNDVSRERNGLTAYLAAEDQRGVECLAPRSLRARFIEQQFCATASAVS